MIDEVIDMLEYEELESAWKIFKKLHNIEYGYIRYDYDEKRERGRLHPLNHLDVNFMNANQLKLGLYKKINIEEFIDIIDTTTECYYLSKSNN